LSLANPDQDFSPDEDRLRKLGFDPTFYERNQANSPFQPSTGSRRGSDPGAVVATDSPGRPNAIRDLSPLGVWAEGSIDFGRRDIGQGRRENRFTTTAISAGVDVAVTPSFVAGVGLGYGEDLTKVGSSKASSEAASVVAAAYAGFHPAELAFVDGVIGSGRMTFDTRRLDPTADAYAIGQRRGTMTFGSVAVGFDRTDGRIRWSPYGRLEFMTANLAAFSETGAGIYGLRYKSMDVTSRSGTLGARVSWAVQLRGYRVEPRVRLERSYDFQNSATQTFRYADWVGGQTYSVQSAASAKGSVQTELGVRITSSRRISLDVDYRGATFDGGGSTHGIRVGLDVKF
jgi:outer membrane autotransporter protein